MTFMTVLMIWAIQLFSLKDGDFIPSLHFLYPILCSSMYSVPLVSFHYIFEAILACVSLPKRNPLLYFEYPYPPSVVNICPFFLCFCSLYHDKSLPKLDKLPYLRHCDSVELRATSDWSLLSHESGQPQKVITNPVWDKAFSQSSEFKMSPEGSIWMQDHEWLLD